MSRFMPSVTIAALAIAMMAGTGAASAGSLARDAAELTRSGEAVEVSGLRSRVIAFYDWSDRSMRLTMLLTGTTTGGEVLRTHVTLRDGQSHAMTMSGGDAENLRERFTFTRAGNSVSVAFSAESPLQPIASAPLAPVAVEAPAMPDAPAPTEPVLGSVAPLDVTPDGAAPSALQSDGVFGAVDAEAELDTAGIDPVLADGSVIVSDRTR